MWVNVSIDRNFTFANSLCVLLCRDTFATAWTRNVGNVSMNNGEKATGRGVRPTPTDLSSPPDHTFAFFFTSTNLSSYGTDKPSNEFSSTTRMYTCATHIHTRNSTRMLFDSCGHFSKYSPPREETQCYTVGVVMIYKKKLPLALDHAW